MRRAQREPRSEGEEAFTVIPFHRRHFDAMKRCWCGLFVHQDVTDPDSLPQAPEKDLE